MLKYTIQKHKRLEKKSVNSYLNQVKQVLTYRFVIIT